MNENTSTALAVIPPSSLPTIIAADTDDILGKLKAALRDYVPDATTEEGRDEIGRKKRKIGVAKMDFKRLKDGLLEDAKKTVASVNAEYKIIETNCDALRDAIDVHLEAYKQIDRDRVAAHQEAIEAIEALATFDEIEPPLELIGRRRFELGNRQPRQWQEFGQRAKEIIEGVKARLDALHAAAVKREADAAELVRLSAEQEARDRLAAIQEQERREERIAAEAAARAKADAEAKAATDAKAEADRVEAQRLAAIAKAEADAKAAAHLVECKAMVEREVINRQRIEAERATKLAQEIAAQAERDRADAVAKAEQDRLAAEQRAEIAKAKAEQAQQAAIEAERKRVADAKAAEDSEAARRAADKAHRAEFNREALADLVAAGVSDAHARTVIAAVAKGAIRHMGMKY